MKMRLLAAENSSSSVPSPSPSLSPTFVSDLLCFDSDDYRNPFNGLACSDHVGMNCKDWEWILDYDEVNELLENCPVSCNVTCTWNATYAAFSRNETTSVSSYLKGESSGKTTMDSTVISVLTSLGLVGVFAFAIGFAIIRSRGAGESDGSFLNVVTGPLKQSCDGIKNIDKSKAQNDLQASGDNEKRKKTSDLSRDKNSNEVLSHPEDAEAANKHFRFLPGLNFDDDGSSSSENLDVDVRIHELENEGNIVRYCYQMSEQTSRRDHQSAGTVMDAISVKYGLKTLARRNPSFGESSGCGSSVNSVREVHLLGALRSEDESDFDTKIP